MQHHLTLTRRQIPRHEVGTVRAKRVRQVRLSIPHYIGEFARLRNMRARWEWLYYKLPTMFPLRSFPAALTLEITNECNFSCPHCPRDALNSGRELGFMTVNVFEKIIDESAGHITRLKIIGLGEPSLHPQLDKMMTSLKHKGINTTLYTNGTLFQLFTPTEIFSWALEAIVVSIDGVDQSSFERLRVGGDYRAIRSSLAQFRELRDSLRLPGPHIEIRHVIMPNETLQKLRVFRANWRRGLGDSVKFNFLQAPYTKPRGEESSRPPCRDINREIHIRQDGRVPLCGYDGHSQWIGDVKRTTLRQIWRSDRLAEVRKQHARRDLSDLPFCRTCQFR